MAQPTFDFTHALNGLKNWPSVQVLDFQSSMDPVDVVYSVGGRCVHIDPTSGLYKLGASGVQMPMLLFESPTSFDVANDGGTYWQAGFPTGQQMAIVASGAFEVETTEFDSTGTYPYNLPLKSPLVSQITSGAGQANAGMLYGNRNWAGGNNGLMTMYTDTIVGFVSRGTRINSNKMTVLAFWPFPVFGTA